MFSAWENHTLIKENKKVAVRGTLSSKLKLGSNSGER